MPQELTQNQRNLLLYFCEQMRSALDTEQEIADYEAIVQALSQTDDHLGRSVTVDLTQDDLPILRDAMDILVDTDNFREFYSEEARTRGEKLFERIEALQPAPNPGELRYTHYFDTRVAIQFDSDIEDFSEAFDAWMESLPDAAARRNALLDCQESVSTLMEGVIHSQTDDNFEDQGQAPTAGEQS